MEAVKFWNEIEKKQIDIFWLADGKCGISPGLKWDQKEEYIEYIKSNRDETIKGLRPWWCKNKCPYLERLILDSGASLMGCSRPTKNWKNEFTVLYGLKACILK